MQPWLYLVLAVASAASVVVFNRDCDIPTAAGYVGAALYFASGGLVFLGVWSTAFGKQHVGVALGLMIATLIIVGAVMVIGTDCPGGIV
jgi:tetrahydromethanopterin S-methyltransferase subunit E